MDQKQQWERCIQVFDIKGDGLAMELPQTWTLVTTIVVNKYVTPGLVCITVISNTNKGRETDRYSPWVDTE